MRMGWVELVARMGEMKYTQIILAGKFEGKRPLGRTNDIKYILKKLDGKVWTEFIWLKIGYSVDAYKHGFHKRRRIYLPLINCHLLRKDSAQS
jgi:hypothetical protein